MRLADTEAACLYWGCSRRLLYRWAGEGRLVRHGTAARRLWDLDAMRPRAPGCGTTYYRWQWINLLEGEGA